MNPVWASLLRDASEIHGPVPKWKPTKDKDEDTKKAEWIHGSGVAKGVSDVLEFFGYERQSHDR